MQSVPRRTFPLAAAIVAAAFLLRLRLALAPSFWESEIASLARAGLPSSRILLFSLEYRESPLFPLLVHAAMRLVRIAAPALAALQGLRLISLFAGMAALLAATGEARIWRGSRAAFLVAFLFAFMPSHLFASALLSVDAPLQCLALLSSILWIRYCRANASPLLRRKTAATYLLTAFLGCALDARMLLLLPVHALAGAFARKPSASLKPFFLPVFPLLLDALWRQALVLKADSILPGRESAWRMFVNGLPDFSRQASLPLPGDPAQAGLLLCAACIVAILIALALARLKAGFASRPGGDNESPVFLCGAIVALTAVPCAILHEGILEKFAPVCLPLGLLLAGCLLDAALAEGSVARLVRAGLVLWAGTGLWAALAWPQGKDSCGVFATLKPFIAPMPGDAIVLGSRQASPWLRKSADSLRLLPPEALLDPKAFDSGEPRRPVWVAIHAAETSRPNLMDEEDALLQWVLDTTPGVIDAAIPAEWNQWKRISVVDPEVLPGVAKRLRSGIERLAADRKSPPGVQRLLPGDPAIRFGGGWSILEFSAEGQAFCWSTGEGQSIGWHGPEKPGAYRLTIDLWRTSPFPGLTETIEYRLPGDERWHTLLAGLNAVRIEGEIKTARPDEPLKLELHIPSWQPSIYLPRSKDNRRIGVQLTRVELAPIP